MPTPEQQQELQQLQEQQDALNRQRTLLQNPNLLRRQRLGYLLAPKGKIERINLLQSNATQIEQNQQNIISLQQQIDFEQQEQARQERANTLNNIINAGLRGSVGGEFSNLTREEQKFVTDEIRRIKGERQRGAVAGAVGRTISSIQTQEAQTLSPEARQAVEKEVKSQIIRQIQFERTGIPQAPKKFDDVKMIPKEINYLDDKNISKIINTTSSNLTLSDIKSNQIITGYIASRPKLSPIQEYFGEFIKDKVSSAGEKLTILSKIFPGNTPLRKDTYKTFITNKFGAVTPSTAEKIYKEEQEFYQAQADFKKGNITAEQYQKISDKYTSVGNEIAKLPIKDNSFTLKDDFGRDIKIPLPNNRFLLSFGYTLTQEGLKFTPGTRNVLQGIDVGAGLYEADLSIKRGDFGQAGINLGGSLFSAYFLKKGISNSLFPKTSDLTGDSVGQFFKARRSQKIGLGIAGGFGALQTYQTYQSTKDIDVAFGSGLGTFALAGSGDISRLVRPYFNPRTLDISVIDTSKPQVRDQPRGSVTKISPELIEINQRKGGREITAFGSARSSQPSAKAGSTTIRVTERQLLINENIKPVITTYPTGNKRLGLKPGEILVNDNSGGLIGYEPKKYSYTRQEIKENLDRVIMTYKSQGYSDLQARKLARVNYPSVYNQQLRSTFKLYSGLENDKIVFDILQSNKPVIKGSTFKGKIQGIEDKRLSDLEIIIPTKTRGRTTRDTFISSIEEVGTDKISKNVIIKGETPEQQLARITKRLSSKKYAGTRYKRRLRLVDEFKLDESGRRIRTGNKLIIFEDKPILLEKYVTEQIGKQKAGLTDIGEPVFLSVKKSKTGKENVLSIGKEEEAVAFKTQEQIVQTGVLAPIKSTKQGTLKSRGEIIITPKPSQKSSNILSTEQPFKRVIERRIIESGRIDLVNGKLVKAKPTKQLSEFEIKKGKELSAKFGQDLEVDSESYNLLSVKPIRNIPSSDFVREDFKIKSGKVRTIKVYDNTKGNYQTGKITYDKNGKPLIRLSGFNKPRYLDDRIVVSRIRNALPEIKKILKVQREPIDNSAIYNQPTTPEIKKQGEFPSYVGGGTGETAGKSEYAQISQELNMKAFKNSLESLPAPLPTPRQNVFAKNLQKPINRNINSNRRFPIYKEETETEISTIIRTEPRIETKIETKIEPKIDIRIDTRIFTEPRIDIRTEPRVETRIEPRIDIRTEPKIEITPQTELTPTITPETNPFISNGFGRKKTKIVSRRKRVRTKAYTILLKKRGTFVPVAKGLPRGRALQLLQRKQVTELTRQGRIVESGTTDIPDIDFRPNQRVLRQYKVRQGKKVALPFGQFIQNIGATLQTPEEKSLIKYAKRSKKSRNNLF